MKKKRRLQYDGYEVDEKFIGELNDHTVAIVIDNYTNRMNNKTTVRSYRTEKPDLLAGLNTVAVFTNFKNKIKF